MTSFYENRTVTPAIYKVPMPFSKHVGRKKINHKGLGYTATDWMLVTRKIVTKISIFLMTYFSVLCSIKDWHMSPLFDEKYCLHLSTLIGLNIKTMNCIGLYIPILNLWHGKERSILISTFGLILFGHSCSLCIM